MKQIKTPEQMAEEFADSGIYRLKRYVDGRIKPIQGQHGFQHLACKKGFLAGYQAAKNSPEKPDSWISVKERLPEHGVPVLVFDTLANTIELMSWDKIMEVFETDDAYFVQLNDASHWMPLPKPPEEK